MILAHRLIPHLAPPHKECTEHEIHLFSTRKRFHEAAPKPPNRQADKAERSTP